MTDAFDLMAEAKWEMEGVRRAAERYREAAAAADPSTLPSGQKLLRDVIPQLREAIIQKQLEGARAIARGGNPPKWAWPIQLLDAEKLAVITIIRSLPVAEDPEGSLTALAKDICQSVRDELEYVRWVAEQKATNKAAKEDKDAEHRDVLAAFEREYPSPDRRVWATWRRKLKIEREAKGPEDVQVVFGSLLIALLVEASDGRFAVTQRSLGAAKTQSQLRLDDRTRAMMQDIEARKMVARPMLMPMIIPPIPWKYE